MAGSGPPLLFAAAGAAFILKICVTLFNWRSTGQGTGDSRHTKLRNWIIRPLLQPEDAATGTATEDNASKEDLTTPRINTAFELSSDPISCFTLAGDMLFQNSAAMCWFQESKAARELNNSKSELRSVFSSQRDYDSMVETCVHDREIYEATLQMPADDDTADIYHHIKVHVVADPGIGLEGHDVADDMLIVSQIDSVEVKRLQAEMRLAMEAMSASIMDAR